MIFPLASHTHTRSHGLNYGRITFDSLILLCVFIYLVFFLYFSQRFAKAEFFALFSHSFRFLTGAHSAFIGAAAAAVLHQSRVCTQRQVREEREANYLLFIIIIMRVHETKMSICSTFVLLRAFSLESLVMGGHTAHIYAPSINMFFRLLFHSIS